MIVAFLNPSGIVWPGFRMYQTERNTLRHPHVFFFKKTRKYTFRVTEKTEADLKLETLHSCASTPSIRCTPHHQLFVFSTSFTVSGFFLKWLLNKSGLKIISSSRYLKSWHSQCANPQHVAGVREQRLLLFPTILKCRSFNALDLIPDREKGIIPLPVATEG